MNDLTHHKRIQICALAAALIALFQPVPSTMATTVTNALTVHLKFEGDLTDSTANHIDGTNMALGTSTSAGVTFTSGFLGQAVHLIATVDGTTNNFVSLGYPALLHFGSDATMDTSDFSVAMWLKVFSSTADEPFISNKNWDSSGNLGWIVSNESDGTRVQLTDSINSTRNIPTHAGPQLEDHSWHHLAVSFQRTNVASVYVDGLLVSSFSIAPAAGNAVGSLDTDGLPVTRGPGWAVNLGEDGTGEYPVPNGAALDCLMDDFGLWRRVLTASEVLEIYNKGAISGKTLEQEPGVLFTAILTQPTNLTVTAGVRAVFTVSAAGQAPLAYQWQKNGVAISNATNATYSIVHSSPADVGSYVVTVSGPGGTKSSSPASLSVLAPSALCSLNNGLAAYLQFDGNLNDSSTNGVNGISGSGNTNFVPGVVGQAVHIVSTGDLLTNDYVSLGYPAALMFGTNDFTICFWAKEFSQNDDKPFISNKNWGNGSNPGWVIATQTGGMKWNFKDSLSSRRDSGTFAGELLDHQWHHIAVVFQRTTVGSIYVDGVLENSANVAPDPGMAVGSADTDPTSLSVNLGQDGTGNYTDGGSMAAIDFLMDELGIWTRTLSPQEVVCIYTHGLAGKSFLAAANATPITINRPAITGTSVTVTWFGNANVFILQRKTSLTDQNWINIQTNSTSTATLPISGLSGFFRVIGQ